MHLVYTESLYHTLFEKKNDLFLKFCFQYFNIIFQKLFMTSRFLKIVLICMYITVTPLTRNSQLLDRIF